MAHESDNLYLLVPEEGQRTHWSKHCEYNNKDEDNTLNKLNNKHFQASSKKFRQIMKVIVFFV